MVSTALELVGLALVAVGVFALFGSGVALVVGGAECVALAVALDRPAARPPVGSGDA